MPDGVRSLCLSGSARNSANSTYSSVRAGISTQPLPQNASKSGHRRCSAHARAMLIEVLNPRRLVASLGKLRLEPSRRRGRKDIEIVARLANRLDRLLHGDDKGIPPRAADIVALERRRRRQHDVGVAGGRRPPRLVHNDGFGPLPGSAQPVEILMMMERIAAGPIDQPDVGIGAARAVEVVAPAG